MQISPTQLIQDTVYLTQTIGVRLTGTAGENAACRYLQKRFLEYTPKCTLESFPVMAQHLEQLSLEVLTDGRWASAPASLLNGSPCGDGQPLEAELVVFQSHTDYRLPDLSHLRGKGVIHFGAAVPDEDAYRRLMEAEPAFILMADTRYPSAMPVANGLYPAYIRKYGAVPTLNVAYQDAWAWCTTPALRARIQIRGKNCESASHNVVAELTGTAPDADCIYLCAHADTQADTVGADDNAIGCAILLELARVLAARPHRNTIRLIAFGAEEILSLGSAEYVRAHHEELTQHGAFVCNFDSCGSAAGWNQLITSLDDALSQHVRDCFEGSGCYYTEVSRPDPFNDLFPFTALGIAGITVMRRNCESGVFYHHRPDNTMEILSADRAAELAQAALSLIEALADTEHLKSFCRCNPRYTHEVQQLWTETFGGWNAEPEKEVRANGE